jgi:hypothetical protein
MPGGRTFSWNKRAANLLKKWKPVFEASVVNWTSYWHYDGKSGVLRLRLDNEGVPTNFTSRHAEED